MTWWARPYYNGKPEESQWIDGWIGGLLTVKVERWLHVSAWMKGGRKGMLLYEEAGAREWCLGNKNQNCFWKMLSGFVFFQTSNNQQGNNHCHQTVIRPAILSLPPEKSPGFMN